MQNRGKLPSLPVRIRLMLTDLVIRPAKADDAPAIWHILKPVIREGRTYPISQNITEKDALAYWFSTAHQVFVATINQDILGTFYIRPNQAGAGSHVANCGYMTAPNARGKGIAKAMCEQSQKIAKECGYTAIQFNFVIATNIGAIGLWQKLGFEIMGRLPEVFNHPEQGLVDALVMFKKLS